MKKVAVKHSVLLSAMVESLVAAKAPIIRPPDVHGDILLETDSWEPLEEYIKKQGALDYHTAQRLVVCLGLQLTTLTGLGYGLASIAFTDITVIDKDWYLLTNLSSAMPLIRNSQLRIIKPLGTKGFLAPELKQITQLPAIVDQSCAFYSIALLCLAAMKLSDKPDDIKLLFPSPLYFLLERCLLKNPEERVFLLV